MSNSRALRISPFTATCLGVVAVGLAGCGGAGTISPAGEQPHARGASTTASRPYANTSACSNRVVYAASYDNSVYVYNQAHNHGTPCGQITGITNPQGLFVDNKNNLWVAVGGNCRTVFSEVLEFAPGNPTPIKTLKDPAGAATDVAVDRKSGTVYVTNFFDYTQGCASGNPGAVEVYANGSTTPTSALTDPNMTYAFYDAVDKQGNVYVTYLMQNGPTGVGKVDEWIGGTGSPHNLGITLKAPGGIQTTSSGALLICDQAAPACGDFAPGSTTMTNQFATNDKDPFAVALDAREHHAYLEDSALGELQRWAYPGPDTRRLQRIKVPGGAYAGVAVSPPSPPGAPY